MLTDTELKRKGLRVLIDNLGDVNAEKFISLISKEPFDYTIWQSQLWKDESVDFVSEKAMEDRTKSQKNKQS